MTYKQLKIILLTLLSLGLIADVLVRLFYCSSMSLSFNSQEFNNIASPIISFLGFVAVIVTLILTLNQFKHQQGSNYFNYYRDYINKIAKETKSNSENPEFSTTELLDFPIYSWDKFFDLKKDQEYIFDMEKFKNGETVSSNNKKYDIILGNVRLFAASISILLKRYISLIKEIDAHKHLDSSQKDLLIKDLFDSQVTKYFLGCWILDEDPEMKNIKTDFFIAFAPIMKDKLLFYNEDFFNLQRLIESRPELKKLTKG